MPLGTSDVTGILVNLVAAEKDVKVMPFGVLCPEALEALVQVFAGELDTPEVRDLVSRLVEKLLHVY